MVYLANLDGPAIPEFQDTLVLVAIQAFPATLVLVGKRVRSLHPAILVLAVFLENLVIVVCLAIVAHQAYLVTQASQVFQVQALVGIVALVVLILPCFRQ